MKLRTTDGATLDADVAEAAMRPARGVAVLCHPHPSYGGNRFHPLIERWFVGLPAVGFDAIRFDFRPPPPGAPDGNATAVADLTAAIDHAAEQGDGDIVVAGYSYGAVAAILSDDPRVRRIAAVAPPLDAVPLDRPPNTPILLVVPRHDQFTSPEHAAELTAGWDDVERVVVESCDHFLTGRIGEIADTVTGWLAAPLDT